MTYKQYQTFKPSNLSLSNPEPGLYLKHHCIHRPVERVHAVECDLVWNLAALLIDLCSGVNYLGPPFYYVFRNMGLMGYLPWKIVLKIKDNMSEVAGAVPGQC